MLLAIIVLIVGVVMVVSGQTRRRRGLMRWFWTLTIVGVLVGIYGAIALAAWAA